MDLATPLLMPLGLAVALTAAGLVLPPDSDAKGKRRDAAPAALPGEAAGYCNSTEVEPGRLFLPANDGRDTFLARASLPCTYAVPEADEDAPGRVAVELNAEGATERLARVADAASCKDAASFYVAAGAVALCDQTCDRAQNRPELRVRVRYACSR